MQGLRRPGKVLEFDLSFFLLILARSNFDHYARECNFGILKKKQKQNKKTKTKQKNKKIYLGPGKLLEFEKSAFCPGIVREFCKIILENMSSALKNLKYN